jgi:hypothetical protein
VVVALGEDQVLDELAALAEEHVLGPAQADALRAEATGPLGVLGGVGVGADREAACLVCVGHQPVHGLHELVGGTFGVERLRVELALEVLHDR